MPVAPLRFEVFVNGDPVGTVGTNDFGVLTAIVGWVKRNPAAITTEMRGNPKFNETLFLTETCDLQLSALDSVANRHELWNSTTLKPGDEVIIKVLALASTIPHYCHLTPRSSGRVRNKVPSSCVGVRAAQLNR
jgi:hypothetical protein